MRRVARCAARGKFVFFIPFPPYLLQDSLRHRNLQYIQPIHLRPRFLLPSPPQIRTPLNGFYVQTDSTVLFPYCSIQRVSQWTVRPTSPNPWYITPVKITRKHRRNFHTSDTLINSPWPKRKRKKLRRSILLLVNLQPVASQPVNSNNVIRCRTKLSCHEEASHRPGSFIPSVLTR